MTDPNPHTEHEARMEAIADGFAEVIVNALEPVFANGYDAGRLSVIKDMRALASTWRSMDRPSFAADELLHVLGLYFQTPAEHLGIQEAPDAR